MFDAESRLLRSFIGSGTLPGSRFGIRWVVVGLVAFCAVFWAALLIWLL